MASIEFKLNGGKPGAGGTRIITVDGKKVAEGRIEKKQPSMFSVDDPADGTPVTDYGASAKFNGKISYVTIDRKK